MSFHKAVRTPADLPGSGWYELLPKPAPPKILKGKQNADWAIVGAGFAGLSAARRLSKLVPSERIAVVEAQRVGWALQAATPGS
jgi:hypothetical protein